MASHKIKSNYTFSDERAHAVMTITHHQYTLMNYINSDAATAACCAHASFNDMVTTPHPPHPNGGM